MRGCAIRSSDGALAAWGTEKGQISIVATDTGDQVQPKLTRASEAVMRCKSRPDFPDAFGWQLALWKAHYHHVSSCAVSPVRTGHLTMAFGSQVYSLSFSPDDKSLLSSGLDIHPSMSAEEAATL